MNLPAYWKACRHARAQMDVTEERVAYGPHRRQYAVVVRNRDVETGKIAFYFHGGGWTFGRPETFVPAAIPWLAAGFTVILPSYRRPPTVGLHRIMADCRAALAHFLSSGEVTEIHLGGISAGAHLAALLAARPEYWPIPPRKVLCCAGPLSFADVVTTRLLLPWYAEMDALSALTSATPTSPSWLLLHGTADGVVSPRHSRQFYARLQALGHRAHLELLPGGNHLDAGRWMFGLRAADLVRAFIAGDMPNSPIC